jgi:hypothetical protein
MSLTRSIVIRELSWRVWPQVWSAVLQTHRGICSHVADSSFSETVTLCAWHSCRLWFLLASAFCSNVDALSRSSLRRTVLYEMQVRSQWGHRLRKQQCPGLYIDFDQSLPSAIYLPHLGHAWMFRIKSVSRSRSCICSQ